MGSRRESRRERRFRLTMSVARRRWRLHLSRIHPDGELDCVCERSALYFEDRTALRCGCRRRRAGRPKSGTGCWSHELRPAVRARIDARKILAALRAGRLDPDEVPRPIGRRGRMGRW